MVVWMARNRFEGLREAKRRVWMRSEKLDSLVVGDILRQRAVTHRSEIFLKFHEGELSYGEMLTDVLD